MKWARDHRKFAAYLVEFADSRVKRADFLAEKYDDGRPETIEDAERDNDVRASTYQLANDAVCSPKSSTGPPKTHLLATTEKYFGHFAEAYERISRVIAWFDPGSNNDTLFFSHQLRGWLVCAGPKRTAKARGHSRPGLVCWKRTTTSITAHNTWRNGHSGKDRHLISTTFSSTD